MDTDVKKFYDINGNGEKTDDSSVIPVNTRCIGKPSGIYILYIEDYVHTYIRKILSIKYYANLMNPRLALYGKKYQSEWQIILVIFGAAVLDEKDSKELIQKYFNSENILGIATPAYNNEGGIRLEITLNSNDILDKPVRVAIDDFYIYYDQNENMQNYLIEWSNRNNIKSDESVFPLNNIKDQKSNDNKSDAYSKTKNPDIKPEKIEMKYDKKQSEISRLGNLVSVIIFAGLVCVLAYSITLINNYNKLYEIQDDMEYFYALLANGGEQLNKPVMTTEVINMQSSEESVQEQTDTQESFEDNSVIESEIESENETNTENIADKANSIAAVSQTNPTNNTPQYYIVQKGDTLRDICLKKYGNIEKVKEICEINDIDDANTILYGQKLLLPW